MAKRKYKNRETVPEPSEDEVYGALTGDKSAFVHGPDFFALNYGPRYPGGGYRWVSISGDKVSYEAITEASDFPKKLAFRVREPLIAIVNASHIDDMYPIRQRTKLSLETVVKILRDRGVVFEEK